MNEIIAKHLQFFAFLYAGILIAWFISGLYFLDIIDPQLFIGIFIPIGLILSFIPYKW